MPRRLKQVLYGAFYLAIFAGIFWLWYANSLRPAPTCTDQRRNQGETEVDCGGPCAPCELRGLKQGTAENVRFMKLGSDVAVVARLTNPNEGYRARVTYEVRFTSSGIKTHETTGTLIVYPESPAHMYVLRHDADRDTNASVFVLSTEWEAHDPLSLPSVAVGEAETAIGSDGSAVVTGSVENRGLFLLRNVEIIAILKTENEFPVFASRTEEDIPAGAVRSFTVTFPKSGEFTERVSGEKTEIIAHAGE